MLRNLLAEMKRHNVKNSDMAKTINKSDRAVNNKIQEITDFSFPESESIRDEHFPGMALEYLFKKEH